MASKEVRCKYGHRMDDEIVDRTTVRSPTYYCPLCKEYMLPHFYVSIEEEEVAGVVPQVAIEAANIVYSDRRISYGGVENNFARIGACWGSILNIPAISPENVALMMIALKLCREGHKHTHDNLVDIIGYTYCLAELVKYND